ncbi:MAG: class I SAM-dependent methyltransferase [Muribaculaceae bacterium]|nr:class I SAM-dependent methyltransferase [Muribaculaceae bacterium]
MAKAFDEYAEKYDAWFLENSNVLYSEVKLVARCLRDAGRTFSVGCGSGLFELILRREYNISVDEGLEPSVAMAEIARKRGMKVAVTTAEDHDFGSESYDTILLNGTPSYITDLGAVLRKCYNALRPGGRIVVIDVPKESSYGILYNLAKSVGTWDDILLKGCYPPNPYPIEFVNAANWRTTAEKVDLMHKAGFCDLEYAQTLTHHPLYSNNFLEEPSDGYERGDYVAVTGYKK